MHQPSRIAGKCEYKILIEENGFCMFVNFVFFVFLFFLSCFVIFPTVCSSVYPVVCLSALPWPMSDRTHKYTLGEINFFLNENH